MIKISELVKKKVIALMQEDGFDASTDYVRVGVKSGGCSGLSYDLNFDKELKENDKIFEDDNIKITIEKNAFYIWWEPSWSIQEDSTEKDLFSTILMHNVRVDVGRVFHYKKRK